MRNEPDRTQISDDLLKVGLQNAFGPDPSDVEESSPSVLAALKRLAGPVSPLRLRELRRDGSGPAAGPVPDGARDAAPADPVAVPGT